jgi:hypothetical protein
MFEPLCKFKVGDIVKGTPAGDHEIEHKDAGYAYGGKYWVDPKYFELVSNDVELTLEDIAKLAGLDPSQIRIMK